MNRRFRSGNALSIGVGLPRQWCRNTLPRSIRAFCSCAGVRIIVSALKTDLTKAVWTDLIKMKPRASATNEP